MIASVAIAPKPLPGKTQPVPKPQLEWVGMDLVSADVEYLLPDGNPTRTSVTYQAMGPGPVSEGTTQHGPTDVNAFTKLPHASFVDAVEAASRIAVAHPLKLNVKLKDPAEKSASLAIALLQAADGAWYTTALTEPNGGGTLTVDTGRANVAIHDVSQEHPAVKAVVGAHSWVNFTDEAIEPKLAG